MVRLVQNWSVFSLHSPNLFSKAHCIFSNVCGPPKWHLFTFSAPAPFLKFISDVLHGFPNWSSSIFNTQVISDKVCDLCIPSFCLPHVTSSPKHTNIPLSHPPYTLCQVRQNCITQVIIILFQHLSYKTGSPDSSVSIVTRYGLSGPEFKLQKNFLFSKTVQTGSGAHPSSNWMEITNECSYTSPTHFGFFGYLQEYHWILQDFHDHCTQYQLWPYWRHCKSPMSTA